MEFTAFGAPNTTSIWDLVRTLLIIGGSLFGTLIIGFILADCIEKLIKRYKIF